MNVEQPNTNMTTRTASVEPGVTFTRRYDIDWIRVIAIGLLIIYHAAVAFQPWGIMIGFVANKNSWSGLWLPMAILNVWRIPLLFFVSGMGVYFAMQSRTWQQLITERAQRIFVPFLFGMFAIVPVQVLLWRYHYNMQLMYNFNPGHLWFLGNIMAYVVIWAAAFYAIKKNGSVIRKIFSTPFAVLIVTVALMAEVFIIKPFPYELYAMTMHGFFLGLIAFFFGYVFAFTGTPFWNMIVKWRWILFLVAAVLATLRLNAITATYMIPPESVCWILFIFSLSYQFLNKPGKTLTYLSQAAYPVYIVHLIFQFLGSMLIFKLAIPVQLQFVMLVVFTLGGCLLTYEFFIRRTKVTRFLFGLKTESKRVQP